MSRLVGVIPAAGRGTRAYPYTRGIPKCMLEIDGEPILARTLRLFRDQLRIKDVVIVVNDLGAAIRERFGDGAALGLNLTYLVNDAVERGLGYSIWLARGHVEERFVVVLSDECYLDSNHQDLLAAIAADDSALAVCAVAGPDDPEEVRRNYAVEIDGGVVRRLVEKPSEVAGASLGLGTFVLHRRIFEHLERALRPGSGEASDLVSVLARACAAGERIRPFALAGRYVNVNDRDQLNLANNIVRGRDFAARSRSIAVLHRGSLERSLRTVAEFRAACPDAVLVVPPEVAIGPSAAAGVKVVAARSGAFGDLMRAGLDALSGDILFTVYGDGTFSPGDVPKFLEYLKEADLVVGTRTTRQLIHQGSNMRGVVRMSQVALAKFLELLWWGREPRLTDVGCAYRALWRSTYALIRPSLSRSGPESSVEMLVETLRCRKRLIEIPVNFRLPHKGIRERDQNWRTVAAIVALVVRRRFERPAAGEERAGAARGAVA